MAEIEQKPVSVPLKRRRFQYSLRTIFALTGATAVFFSVASSLGYVDALIALVASLILVAVVRYPRRVQLATGVLLTLVAGALLWANVGPTGWQREFGDPTPKQLDPLTKSMFWRGWPLCPFMLCEYHRMILEPGGEGALVVDGAVFVAVLVAVRAICERCVGWALVITCVVLAGLCGGYWIGHREITGPTVTLQALAWVPIVWLGQPLIFVPYAVTALALYLPVRFECQWLRISSLIATFLSWLIVVAIVVERASHGEFWQW